VDAGRNTITVVSKGSSGAVIRSCTDSSRQRSDVQLLSL
jgi:hypothetical protein